VVGAEELGGAASVGRRLLCADVLHVQLIVVVVGRHFVAGRQQARSLALARRAERSRGRRGRGRPGTDERRPARRRRDRARHVVSVAGAVSVGVDEVEWRERLTAVDTEAGRDAEVAADGTRHDAERTVCTTYTTPQPAQSQRQLAREKPRPS